MTVSLSARLWTSTTSFSLQSKLPWREAHPTDSKQHPSSPRLLIFDPTGLGNGPSGKAKRDWCPLSRLSSLGREGTGSGFESTVLHSEIRTFPLRWRDTSSHLQEPDLQNPSVSTWSRAESTARWPGGGLPPLGGKRMAPSERGDHRESAGHSSVWDVFHFGSTVTSIDKQQLLEAPSRPSGQSDEVRGQNRVSWSPGTSRAGDHIAWVSSPRELHLLLGTGSCVQALGWQHAHVQGLLCPRKAGDSSSTPPQALRGAWEGTPQLWVPASHLLLLWCKV